MSTHPDAQIFPHATAAAAETVAKHQEPQELVFYSGWFCPFAQRTWIALEERGVPYQYVEVNPYKKEQHFLDINPKGLVPAFEYHGKALYESYILNEFLEDAFPSSTPHLLPSDPYTRAYARIWLDHISKNVVPAFFRLLTAQEPEKQKAGLEDVTAGLRTFAEKIKGPYFLGEEFSLVDVAIAPFVVRDYVLIEHRAFGRDQVSKEWKEYAKRVEKRESVARTTSEKDKYMTIFGRYLRDEAQSEVAKATRAGKVIP